MTKPLKIVSVASEVAPYSKSGGLADVARSLPRAIRRFGHKVVVVTPFYSEIINVKEHNLTKAFSGIPIELSKDITLHADIWQGELMKGLPIFFIENEKYFGRRKSLYGSTYENARFFFFDAAVLKLLKIIDFKPDVIHCNDWHTGLIPYFLKGRYKNDEFFANTASMFTIHNLTFQFGHNWWEIKRDRKDDGKSPLPVFGDSDEIERINFAKRAIINVDLINAVSENYAKEIITKDFGEDLNVILKNRKKKLFGVINGIDYNDYNPQTDPALHENFGPLAIHKKLSNKEFLQKELSLPVRTDVPMLGMVSRITEQKGFDLLMEIFDDIMSLDVQFVIVGSGEKKYEKFFQEMKKKYPEKVGVHLEFDQSRASQIYAAADIFLMPSRFEPCGLGQLISLRYGCIPVVRATGGLLDTITDFNIKTNKGNGFVFHNYDARAFFVAIARAVATFNNKELWPVLVQNGFKESLSWKVPAKKYITLFRKAIRFKRANGNGK